MYESYYGLKEKPFRLECKPEFLFPGKNFSEILAQLENAINERKELCVLSGLAGIGKTTLCESLLEKLQPGFICKMVAYSPENPTSPLHTILSAFGIDSAGQNEFELIGLGQAFLNRNYLKENLSAVLIVDDAHYLSEDQLGQFCSLVKLFSAEHSLLRVILAGKPTLVEKIKRAGSVVTAKHGPNLFELGPLNADETKDFIVQRLRAVGSRRDNYFDQRACQSVFEYCRGIPKQINIFCNVALEYGAIERAPRINQALIDDVAKDNGVDKFLLLCDEEQSNQPLWDEMSLAGKIAMDQSPDLESRTPDANVAEELADPKVPDSDSDAERKEVSSQPADFPNGSDEDKTKWNFLHTYRAETTEEPQSEKNVMSAGDTQQPDDHAGKGKKLTFNYLDSYKDEPKENSFEQHIDYEAEKTSNEGSVEIKEIVEDALAPIPPNAGVPAEAAMPERRNPVRKTGLVIAIAAGIAGVAITILLFQLLPLVVDPTKTADSYKQSPLGGLAETSKKSEVNPGSRSSKELLAEANSPDRLSGAASGTNNQDGYNKRLSEKQAHRNERPATADISVFEQSDTQSLADRGGELASGSTRLEKDEPKSTQPVPRSGEGSNPAADQNTVGENGRDEDLASNNRISSVPNDGRMMTEEVAGAVPGEASENPVVTATSIDDRIEELMARADELYERRMLTTPVGGSALASYQEVLLVNPNHPEALEGVRKIKQRYIDWAEEAKQTGDIKNVAHYLEKALSLDPRDGKVAKSLRNARREQARYAQKNAESDISENIPRSPISSTDSVRQTSKPRQYIPPVSIEQVNHELVFDGKPSIFSISAKIHGPVEKVEVLVSTAEGYKPYSMYDDASHGDKNRKDGIYNTLVRLRLSPRGTRFYIAAYTKTGGIVYNPPNAEREPYRITSQSVAGRDVEFSSQISRVRGQKALRPAVNQDASGDR